MDRRKILSYLGVTSFVAFSSTRNSSAAKQNRNPPPIIDNHVRYVSINGDNGSDGLTWGTPFLDLSKAINQLTDGGTIYMSGGNHNIGDIDIVNANINIVGTGMGSTVLQLNSGSSYGIKFTGNADNCSIRELRFQGNASEHQKGVYIDDREFIHLDRVRFRVFGIDITGTVDADIGACGIYVIGTNQLGAARSERLISAISWYRFPNREVSEHGFFSTPAFYGTLGTDPNRRWNE